MPAAQDVVTPLNIVLGLILDKIGPKSSSFSSARVLASPYR
jgi:hypothetical protein